MDALEHDTSGARIRLGTGQTLEATLVVDASGASSRFISRKHEPSRPAIQSAYGIITSLEHDSLQPGTAVLMDWRGPDHRDATFLYALSLDGNRWLLEETSLARRTALPPDVLERRLHDRLRRMRVRLGKIDGVEVVKFAVEVGIPDRNQPAIGFGAAAGLTHPATGYSVVRSFRAAPAVAAALHSALDHGPLAAAHAGWHAMWSDDRVRARGLEQYGLNRLLRMNQRETRAFFDTFFALPAAQSAAYLSGEATSAELTSVMWALFRASSRRMQAKLAAGNPLAVARSLTR